MKDRTINFTFMDDSSSLPFNGKIQFADGLVIVGLYGSELTHVFTYMSNQRDKISVGWLKSEEGYVTTGSHESDSHKNENAFEICLDAWLETIPEDVGNKIRADIIDYYDII